MSAGKAPVVPCEITLEDGTVLRASSPLALAWRWAEAVNGDAWDDMAYGEQCSEVADALAALNRSYAGMFEKDASGGEDE